jgi:hypothetical protein
MLLKRLLKIPYHIRDLIHYSKAFSRREYTDMVVREVNDDSYLLAAKKLHANVYLSRGFVQENDIDQGVLSTKADPHQKHSTYFVVVEKRSGRILATSRQIESKREKGHNSFAIMGQAFLYPGAIKRIKNHLPEESVEISGLAKQRGVSKLAPLLLYRAMWHRSLRSKHKLWLLAIDTKLFIRLKLLFGPTIRKAGKVTPYYGGDVVPAILDVQSSITSLNKSLKKRVSPIQRPLRAAVIRFMLNGLPVEHLSASEKRAYKELKETLGIEGRIHKEEYRVFDLRIKILWAAILASLAYTIVRFLLVKYTLQAYGVDPWLFLALDAIAGVIYVLAVERLVTNLIRKEKSPLKVVFAWTLVALVTFSVPYIYIFIASKELSTGVTAGLFVLVALLLVNAVVSVRNKVRKNIAE